MPRGGQQRRAVQDVALGDDRLGETEAVEHAAEHDQARRRSPARARAPVPAPRDARRASAPPRRRSQLAHLLARDAGAVHGVAGRSRPCAIAAIVVAVPATAIDAPRRLDDVVRHDLAAASTTAVGAGRERLRRRRRPRPGSARSCARSRPAASATRRRRRRAPSTSSVEPPPTSIDERAVGRDRLARRARASRRPRTSSRPPPRP